MNARTQKQNRLTIAGIIAAIMILGIALYGTPAARSRTVDAVDAGICAIVSDEVCAEMRADREALR